MREELNPDDQHIMKGDIKLIVFLGYLGGGG